MFWHLTCFAWRFRFVKERAQSRAGSIIVDALDILIVIIFPPPPKKAMELSEILYNKAEYIETVFIFLFF